MPYKITHCYLPPDGGDIAALTPAEAGTRLSRRVEMSFGTVSGWSSKVVISITFHQNRSCGFRAVGDRKLPYPTALATGLYSS